MMVLAWTLALVGVFAAGIPTLMFLANLPLFCVGIDQTSVRKSVENRDVSVLIPARNEAASIARCIESVLQNRGVNVEVIVLEDNSSDATAEIVRGIAEVEQSVRCLAGNALPDGWNGKQYACWQLALEASYTQLLFLDADVRLSPDAIERLLTYQEHTGVSLLSAFPHQATGTILEKLLIPLMHYMLLCFLPFSLMRTKADPMFAAGCGQLFLTTRDDYTTAGTHSAIRESRHDGLKLPRIYRQAGLRTDVIDGTNLAECRMYHSGPEVMLGLLKNATEGIANRHLIAPFSFVLIAANVFPILSLVIAVWAGATWCAVVALIAIGLAHIPRTLAMLRFRQPLVGVLGHSIATLLFVVLQWVAFAMAGMGLRTNWRGRSR
ncbi:glycosyltransferase family 2 protein [Novipirellula artificiosorum]|uniref:4,4'-diaponeurosporenoate glycosyltransferase n=1 Tax=Novipirellula artificiosorum TaxID=2528016 RepID=A0A5C6E4E7_9BACT|nr:glycosyltransferase family 2 protein [Novipirellula artificiosorum]TWU42461.1 4,4'-diaponeurosporenoate glycosyltransferase [Novipirellula artificiosorum]